MVNIMISEEQLARLVNKMKPINESRDGSYMAKQQLFTIATMAHEMWQALEEGEQLDDWMESKISQADQSITSVVKAYFYDEVTKNVIFNVLDLFSKCFVGIFFWAYYTKVFKV